MSAQVKVTNSDHPTIGDSRTIHNPQERFALCFRKWFVAMVASWLYDEVVNQQVLVLIGKQGI